MESQDYFNWKSSLRSPSPTSTTKPCPQVQLLNSSRDGDSSTGKPVPGLDKPFYERVFLISHINLPWHNLIPFTLVLSPVVWENRVYHKLRVILPFLLVCLLLPVTSQIRGEKQLDAHWNTFTHLFLNLLSDWHRSLWFLTRHPSPGEVGECDCTNVLASLKTQQDLLFIQLYFALLFYGFIPLCHALRGAV